MLSPAVVFDFIELVQVTFKYRVHDMGLAKNTLQINEDIEVRAKVTDQVPRGMVWMAFHFREACANWLTNAAFDGVTMTAEYKAWAVRIEKI